MNHEPTEFRWTSVICPIPFPQLLSLFTYTYFLLFPPPSSNSAVSHMFAWVIAGKFYEFKIILSCIDLILYFFVSITRKHEKLFIAFLYIFEGSSVSFQSSVIRSELYSFSRDGVGCSIPSNWIPMRSAFSLSSCHLYPPSFQCNCNKHYFFPFISWFLFCFVFIKVTASGLLGLLNLLTFLRRTFQREG